MSVEKKIWDYLVSQGLTEFGVAGLMGNLKAESNLKPNNLENLCEKRLKENGKKYYTDETYTAAVDNGKISRAEFLNPLPGKQYGYGLAQWTSPGRKAGLYDLVKSRGVSIADSDTQLDFLIYELKNSYQSVWKVLTTAKSVKEASDIVLVKFEAPANTGSSVKATRAKYGQTYYDTYAGKEATMAYTAEAVIAEAKKWVNYCEKNSTGTDAQMQNKTWNAGSGNYTWFWTWLIRNANAGAYYQAQAWCDAFNDYCHAVVGGIAKAKTGLCGGFCYYTPDSAKMYKSAGRWTTTDPWVGDQIFFKNSVRIHHTGIVYKVTSTTVYTIEGNTSSGSAVVANGGCVAMKSYSRSNSAIAGYGHPKYDTSTTSATTTSTKSWLEKGDTGSAVSDLQTKLNACGYNCGEVDGEFGAKTDTAVRSLQKDNNLTVDGQAGVKTMAVLNSAYNAIVNATQVDDRVAWVKRLQKAINAAVDGIPGSETLGKCPTLQNGKSGTVVKLLQTYLGDFCKIGVSGGYDGEFGNGTKAAVMEFQKQNGLTIDGIVGKNTWKKILGL